ncbi:MAG TPA: DUF3179 domain-containing protein [Gammaproteobacteria bacterium]|nr:DUF3179 domain-containing protein [Gammaproteobacteria bacterium]
MLKLLFQSTTLPLRILRITLLSATGYGLLYLAMGNATELPWQQEWPDTDFSRMTVKPSEIISGGPPRDGIPSVDNPRFVAARNASWLRPLSPVILLDINGTQRAYPLEILIYHEIVNDVVDGTPIAVTFCPLCNSALAFERQVNGQTLSFGTTGKLRNSDMIMYDRQTQSWWQQFTGIGIVGFYAGTQLKTRTLRIVAFRDVLDSDPNTPTLSRSTGFMRPYGNNPYHGYDNISDQPFLYDGHQDQRLPAMARVLAIDTGAGACLFDLRRLNNPNGMTQAIINEEPVLILYRSKRHSALDTRHINQGRLLPAVTAYSRKLNGSVLEFNSSQGLRDRATNSLWNQLGVAISGPLKDNKLDIMPGGVSFAFAWLAFRPDSDICTD